ncbi:MAG: hypothetical protein JXR66_08965 [Bacteroidales bacterium]|nr:hypothetical protein [Bacteroidales bacterium]
MKYFIAIVTLVIPLISEDTNVRGLSSAEKKGNIITIEAESFFRQEKNEIRSWVKIRSSGASDSIANQASGRSFIQCQPDTRITSKDKLIDGENFTNDPGKMAVISYKIKIKEPGRYYVWVSCFSTGAEDNGVHVGINGLWPETGKRMQWCEGKNKWTWASKQRTEKVHCGEPYLIYLDIEKPGRQILQFSMREDGFRMDRIMLTTDRLFIPV